VGPQSPLRRIPLLRRRGSAYPYLVTGTTQRTTLPVAVDERPLIVEARHELPAGLATPAEARRLLRQALQSAERHELLEVAELAVSEVVTNAVVHAHTPVELWVGVGDSEVWVEVRDFCPTLPVQRDYDIQATTGRGMGLVSALASACGVHSLGEEGKVVWFCVSAEAVSVDPDDLLAAWDIDDLLDDDAPDPGRDVTLLSMPATLWLSARQHHDALLREFLLYQAANHTESPELATADAARAVISTAVIDAVDSAQAAGTAEPALPEGHPSPLPWVPKQLDLNLKVPNDAASMFATLQDVLDSAERLAVEGRLLIRPALPEIVAVRDWACEQVIAQLAGNRPSAWPGTDQERFEHELHDRAAPALPQWDSTVVTDATTGVIAADDANRIIAVSDRLAEVVGWDPADLVGRRVVTLIPPALREAHVAGFSRHLSTGEAHALGVPLDLPVLRKDGTEVMCRFLVERAPLTQGRAVYLAWIDPLDTEPGTEQGRTT
jgi:PAS domain S-box-containing protein